MSMKIGTNLTVLDHDWDYRVSLLTSALECHFVTSKSDNNAATVLLVINVPRSA